MAAILVIAISVTGDSSTADNPSQAREQTATPRTAVLELSDGAGVPTPSGYPSVNAAVRVTPSENCPSARRAVIYYGRRLTQWRAARTGAVGIENRAARNHAAGCPRYLAHVLQRKAHAARLAYLRWHAYQYDWRSWLPAKWQRIAICETGLNWRHSNSSYEGAFGFALQSWDSFAPRADPKAGPYPPNAYLATPRQQYEVALAIWRMFGLSGWGCRNA